jgi:choline dehydrogenase-like flavoprotein
VAWLQEWVKKNAGTATHAVSTVKMGKPDDPMSCVDSKLRLLGLGNIRVAELSVAPHIVSGHTQALAFLLGHVAAEFVLEQ